MFLGRAGPPAIGVQQLRKDVRDAEPDDFEGVDAVIHLAALSNDPLGDLNPSWTYDVNLEGTLRVAHAAKQSGVQRFFTEAGRPFCLYLVVGSWPNPWKLLRQANRVLRTLAITPA